MRIVKLIVAAAIPFALLGCPDSAKPDPSPPAAKSGAAAAAVPAAAGSAAAPAKSGGW
jgi:hypothetical protein